MKRLTGIGLGWRRALAQFVIERRSLGFVEVLAEDVPEKGPLPVSLAALKDRGCSFAVHSVSVSLGSAEGLDERALHHLAAVSERLGAKVASEHVSFVRAGGRESGHLLPVPFTSVALEVLVENVRTAQRVLPVPFAVENVATLVRWPDPECTEAEFLRRLLDATGCGFLLDLSNLYANTLNFGGDAIAELATLPLERVAYVHVAGGVRHGRLYHDTHAHPLPVETMALVRALRRRGCEAGVMLERDDRFPPIAELEAELDAIATAAGEVDPARLETRSAATKPEVDAETGGTRDAA